MANPAVQRISVPLSAGQRDDIDPKVASLFGPDGIIKRADNLLLRRDGRLGVRNGIQALGMNTVFSSNLVAFQVVSAFGRLFALGRGTANAACIQDLYEKVDTGTTADWRAQVGEITVASVSAQPHIQTIREVFTPQAVGGGVGQADCAAANGLVCLVLQPAGATTLFLNVVRATTGAMVAGSQQTALSGFTMVRVVATATTGIFMLAAVRSSDNGVSLFRLQVGTDLVLTAVTDLFAANANVVTAFDMAPVAGTDNVIAILDRGAATNATIHRCSTAGTLVGTDISIAGTNTIGAAIISDNTNTSVVLVETGGVASLSTYVLASGALLAGPTALFTSVVVSVSQGSPSLCRDLFDATMILIAGQTAAAASGLQRVHVNRRIETTHGSSVVNTIESMSLGSRVMPSQDADITSTGRGLVCGTVGGGQGHASDPRSNALASLRIQRTDAELDHLVGGVDVAAGVSAPQGGVRDTSTGKLYWCAQRRRGTSTLYDCVVYEAVPTDVVKQFQTAQSSGRVLLAGGCLQAADGLETAEVGFFNYPDITSLAETTGGGMTALGVYRYVLVWTYTDAQSGLTRSRVSQIRNLTLTGVNNAASLTLLRPNTWRGQNLLVQQRVVLSLFRTVNGGEIFRKVADIPITATSGSVSGQAYTDLASDATVNLGEILYTTGDVGGLSGVLEDAAPQPCRYVATDGVVVAVAGLPNQFQYQLSKAASPGAGVRFADNVAFFGSVSEPVTGIAFFSNNLFIFSKDSVFIAGGTTPSDAGIPDGETLAEPRLLTPQFGLVDVSAQGLEWRSLIENNGKLWWQADTDKLVFLATGATEPIWGSRPVQATLAAFPVVTGGARITEDNTLVWSCRNLAGNDSVVIARDERTEDWFVHDYNLDIVSMTQLDDKLVFCDSAGLVYAQTSAFTDLTATFIPTTLEFNSLYPAGAGGEAQMVAIEFKGEYRGDCVLEGFISYDDGKNYVTMGSVNIAAANGYVAGDTVTYQRWPARRKGESFRVRFNVTTAGSPTEGLVFNMVNFFVMAQDGAARRRPQDVG